MTLTERAPAGLHDFLITSVIPCQAPSKDARWIWD